MRHWARFVLVLSFPLVIFTPARGIGALSSDEFRASTTGQLVALCSPPPGDPLATPAVNFCHGFAVGVVRVLQEQDAANPGTKAMFCLPKDVDRDQAVAD